MMTINNVELEEAKKYVDDMYKERMNKQVFKEEGKTIICLGEKVEFTDLELASIRLLREIGSLNNENKRLNKSLEEQRHFYLEKLQQKENIIKELNDKIEDDKMIIEGNWGCIDNLRKDYNLQKNIIKEVREYIEKELSFNVVINGKENKVIGYNKAFDKILEILDKGE